MLRPFAALLVLGLLVSGCGNRIKNKEKVQEAIVQRLQTRSGLDLNSLDITTTSVSFNKNMAYATVAFRPKGDPRVDNGMVMKYTLEDRDGKWVVVNVGDSQGHGTTGHGSGNSTQLPPGHPTVSGDRLPPGHPPLTGNSPAQAPGQRTDGRAQ